MEVLQGFRPWHFSVREFLALQHPRSLQREYGIQRDLVLRTRVANSVVIGGLAAGAKFGERWRVLVGSAAGAGLSRSLPLPSADYL